MCTLFPGTCSCPRAVSSRRRPQRRLSWKIRNSTLWVPPIAQFGPGVQAKKKKRSHPKGGAYVRTFSAWGGWTWQEQFDFRNLNFTENRNKATIAQLHARWLLAFWGVKSLSTSLNGSWTLRVAEKKTHPKAEHPPGLVSCPEAPI